MKKILFLIFMAIPLISMAQQPKMHLKVLGGFNGSTFVYRVEGLDADKVEGWQVGGGLRVMYRREFFEVDVTYLDYGLTIYPDEDADFDIEDPISIRMHSLQIPLNIGWIVIKEPVFKWFLYGGLASKFSLKGRYTYQGEKEKFKPNELGLHIYNLGVRFGTQIDIAMFNFDFNYTLGVTNAFKNKARTNSHALELSIGLVF